MGKRKPTQEYLDELLKEEVKVRESLVLAAAELYKCTAVAKLGEPEFEEARTVVVENSKKLLKVVQEIKRVHEGLLKLPELPFEE